MKKMRKAVAVVVLVVAAMTLAQSGAYAAPVRGAAMATSHSENVGIFARFLGILTAIWGDKTAVWVGNGGANNTATWGGPGGH